jgi:hypothetical protein
MLGTLIELPKRIQLQLDILQPEVIPKPGAHQDEFGINIGTGETERLDTNLVELAITTFLRPLVAEHLPHVVEALRMLRSQLVLNQGAHATGRAFRTQVSNSPFRLSVKEYISFSTMSVTSPMARLNRGVGSTIGKRIGL